MFTIYANDFYDSRKLGHWADRFLAVIPEEANALLSSSSSGCAIASAILVKTKKPLIHLYVRKPEDIAHSPYGGALPMRKLYAVIVDDIIESRRTVLRILDFARANEIDVLKIIVVQNYYYSSDIAGHPITTLDNTD